MLNIIVAFFLGGACGALVTYVGFTRAAKPVVKAKRSRKPRTTKQVNAVPAKDSGKVPHKTDAHNAIVNGKLTGTTELGRDLS